MALSWKHITGPALILLSLFGLSGQSLAESSVVTPTSDVVRHLTELYGTATLPSNLLVSQQKDPLGHLLGLQQKNWPAAWISSTFYDYRTTSKYRRQAGLHLGYDIALPFGARVSTGWPGRVVAIVPWTDTEYGVTVASADGTEVTYGHITPTVSVGQHLLTGQTVGTIASDHVDVKMRDGKGRYIPFGEGSQGVIAYRPQGQVSRNQILTAWLVAKSTAQQADDDLYLAKNATQKWQLEKRAARRRIASLEQTLGQLTQPEFETLISRRRLEQLRQEKRQAEQLLKDIDQRDNSTPAELARRRDASLANLSMMESWAHSEGLSWSDVEALIKKSMKGRPEPSSEDNGSDKSQATLTLAQLKEQRNEGQRRLKLLEELYRSGGLSRQEIEDRRLQQQLLEEEYKLRAKRTPRI